MEYLYHNMKSVLGKTSYLLLETALAEDDKT